MTSTEDHATTSAPTTRALPWSQEDDQPRRLLRLPDGRILAFGGEEKILCFNDDEEASVVRTWEDDGDIVEAIAVSPDGRHVAVGLDCGAVHVFVYDSFEKGPHPFAQKPAPGEQEFLALQADSSIRDLQFLRNRSDGCWLVVATESGMQVLNVQNESTVSQSLLEDEVTKCHEGSGIRAVTVLTGEGQPQTVVSTLAMDGRHCFWDLSSSDPSEWNLLQREEATTITKADVGAVLGADAWDRSCRPAVLSGGRIIALPGEPFLQIRWFDSSKKQYVECNAVSEESAHKDVIVVIMARGDYLATSARDGSVMLWQVEAHKACFLALFHVFVRRRLPNFSCSRFSGLTTYSQAYSNVGSRRFSSNPHDVE